MSKSSKVESYQGKQVFIGIDVHKRTYAIASFMDGSVIKRWTTPAKPEKLAVQLKSWMPLLPGAPCFVCTPSDQPGL